MQFKKNVITKAIVMSALFASASASANIAFSSLPGARANSMGGAYIAVANDTSSMFYNPAGIARITGGEVMVEYGDIITQSPETTRNWIVNHQGQPLTDEKEFKFVGGVWGADVGEDSAINIGLSYAPKLYSMPSQQFQNFGNFGGNISETIKFETEVEQIGLGIAGNLGDLAIGFTLDYQNYQTSIVYSDIGRGFDGSGSGACIDGAFCPEVDGDTISEFSAYGFTAGLMYRTEFGENDLSSFSIGAVYRNYSDAEELRDLEVEDNTTQALGFTSPVAPTSWGLGVAIDFPVFDSYQLLLTAQHEIQDFGVVTDDYFNGTGNAIANTEVDLRDSVWQRSSAGAELSFLAESGWQWFIRGGYYVAEDSDFADVRVEYADISALTGGVGVYIPGVGKFESTLEQRSIDNNTPSDAILTTEGIETYDVTLLSLSYTYVWF